MNISDWTEQKRMLLPDHCFGARFAVATGVQSIDETAAWSISRTALPDRSVLWGIGIWVSSSGTGLSQSRMALSDSLPTSTAQFDALDSVFPGFGTSGMDPDVVTYTSFMSGLFFPFRQLLHSQGRRLVVENIAATGAISRISVSLLVSTLPVEIPDCLAF